ncbi:UDP-glucose 4-epimerase GalE [Polynucleobacter paneuropaeus]|uniref:UDP-glucose 4-epimerase n=1 Tax=Polynucleobacter paneuropaeus TaxID=2527775 RepID=A0A9Q2WJC6_9BURK|nr:UDP-glucose 4-epimerase GalE [Polynucleobacter paneuropaeus]
MNILLTGGAGYIGSHTAVALKEAGHSVVIYDNFCNSSKTVLNNLKIILDGAIPYVEGDIRDVALLESTMRDYQIEAVIHFAGLKAVGESVSSPLKYYDNNVVGTLSLIRAMISQNVKNLVFSSSATVYGDPQYLPIDESHPLAPTNPYGRTKLQIEQILEDVTLADSSWKVVNLRYFNPAGAHHSGLLGENPRDIPNNLMPFIAQVATGQLHRLSVFGDDYPTKDGTGVRDFIHVVDLAEGHLAALSYISRSKGFETFNLGTGIGYSVLEMIAAFEGASNKIIPYSVVGRRPGDIASCYASVGKAERVMGWKASRGLGDMCSTGWQFQSQLHNQS